MTPGATNELELERIAADRAPLLENLLELHIHDLSAVFGIEIGPDGRFGYDPLPRYWSEPDDRFAYLIRSGGSVAGFAMVTRGSPASADPSDIDLAEFFVLRSHRRSGIGRRAAGLVWDQHPGRWIVRVAEGNAVALAFWEATIREYAGPAVTIGSYQGKTQPFRVYAFGSGRGSSAVSNPARSAPPSAS